MAYLPQADPKRDGGGNFRIVRKSDRFFGEQPISTKESQQEHRKRDQAAQHTDSGKFPAGFTAHHTALPRRHGLRDLWMVSREMC